MHPKMRGQQGSGWLQAGAVAGWGMLRTQPWADGAAALLPMSPCAPALGTSRRGHVLVWLPQASPTLPWGFLHAHERWRHTVGFLAPNPQYHTLQGQLGKWDSLQEVWAGSISLLLLLQPGSAEGKDTFPVINVIKRPSLPWKVTPGVLQAPVPESPSASPLADRAHTHISLPASPWG